MPNAKNGTESRNIAPVSIAATLRPLISGYRPAILSRSRDMVIVCFCNDIVCVFFSEIPACNEPFVAGCNCTGKAERAVLKNKRHARQKTLEIFAFIGYKDKVRSFLYKLPHYGTIDLYKVHAG